MKIVFTGGGTGGHFYPIIAVAEEIRALARERRLIMPQLFYLGPTAFDADALFENEIRYETCPAGKWRRYFSFQNVTDLFVTAAGFFCAMQALFRIYPDVVFSKGGFASVPVVLAARLLGIPIIIHESDVRLGRANRLAARFAYRIAVAFDETAASLPPKIREKVARTGIPIRKEIQRLESGGAREELHLDPSVPTLLVLGGSTGARAINEVVVGALPSLVEAGNIIHQTGKDHFKEVSGTANVVLAGSGNRSRYHPFPYLNTLSMRRSAGAADLIISRAGMTAVAEIALWGKPAILIPIPEKISHDQRTNAYAYAHQGGAIVLEEANLTPNLLVSEVKRVLGDPALASKMREASKGFAHAEAGKLIAEELIRVGLSHEHDTPQVAP
jgi:UDP-N-acetylglucosamine--N-acetylmuramyl-(pentapeptide) pyrophosphoryl-undecaprenol N-acetylglucosamine transferase